MKTIFTFAVALILGISTHFAYATNTPVLKHDLQVAVYKRSNGIINIAVENKEKNTSAAPALKIRIIDSQGKVIYTERTYATHYFSKNYKLADVAQGVYYIEVSSESQTLVRKITIN